MRDVQGFRWTNAVQSILRQVVKPATAYVRSNTRTGPTGALKRSIRVRNLRPGGGRPPAISMGYSFRNQRLSKVLGVEYGNRRSPFPSDTVRKAFEKNDGQMVRDFSDNWRRYLEAFASRVRRRNATR